MAQELDYDFDKTHIKNSSYGPVAHGNIEDKQKALRAGLLQVLEGKSHSNGSSKLATGKMNAKNAITRKAKARIARPTYLKSVNLWQLDSGIFCELQALFLRAITFRVVNTDITRGGAA